MREELVVRQESAGGYFSSWGEWTNFRLVGGIPPSVPPSRKNPAVSRSTWFKWHSVLEFAQIFRNMGSLIHQYLDTSLAWHIFKVYPNHIQKRAYFPTFVGWIKSCVITKVEAWRMATNWFMDIVFLTRQRWTSGDSSQNILYDGNCIYHWVLKLL